MSRPLAPRHRELPRSDEVDRPARYLLHPLRPVARAIVRAYVRVHAHHEERVRSIAEQAEALDGVTVT